jgi:hypothetical protein
VNTYASVVGNADIEQGRDLRKLLQRKDDECSSSRELVNFD